MEAAAALLSRLPQGFRLPILVVQHLHPSDRGCFAEQLNRRVALSVKEACDKEAVRAGHVYVAPADCHLLVQREETLALSVDERANWSRPSIDVLFGSAAYVWASGLIGVILSGANEDGAAGMGLIAERGGLAIAQDPQTAERPEMPRAAIEKARIERLLPPAGIGDLLRELGDGRGTRGSSHQGQDRGGRG